jgi:hypothetical protein
MKKIKKFKINLRNREITRLLKKTTRVSEINSDMEEKVEAESRRLQRYIFPAAVYETIPRDKFPSELRLREPKNWVAATAYVVTVGDAIEKELKENRVKDNGESEAIAHTIALEGVEQSVNFIERLIRDEADKENCEISKEQSLDSKELLSKVFGIIPGEKIGASLSESGALCPQYSASGIIYWMPITKNKK